MLIRQPIRNNSTYGDTVVVDRQALHPFAVDFFCLMNFDAVNELILLATGAHPRTVGFKGEEEHKGRGVAYCATCDGEFFTGKEIFVVGGGYAAAEESVFLTKFARHVTILVRKDDFSCAASVADQAKNHEKITVLASTVMEEVSGENGLTYARYKNTATGEVAEYKSKETFGVFVFAGYAPATEILKGIVELNEQGYIVTDASQKTSADGVYAAGDVCIKPLRQVVTATSDGALAATELEKYVAAMQRKTGLRADAPSVKQSETTVTVDTHESEGSDELFTKEMRQQLDTVFARMESPLLLKLRLDDRPVSAELEQFITALAALSNAYFMPLKASPTVETLAEIFTNNIVPLLQEYFYEDYEKIRLVLGDNRKSNPEEQFIVAKENDYLLRATFTMSSFS